MLQLLDKIFMRMTVCGVFFGLIFVCCASINNKKVCYSCDPESMRLEVFNDKIVTEVTKTYVRTKVNCGEILCQK